MALRVMDKEEWELRAGHGAISRLIRDANDTIHWTHRRDGKWARGVNGGICCGTMPSNKRENTDALLVTLNGSQDKYIQWWHYVLDPDHSPWHRVLKGVELYKEFRTPYYGAFKIDIDGTTGFKDLINLLIGTRQTYENYSTVVQFFRDWDEFKKVDSTCTFSEALALHCFYEGGLFYEQAIKYNSGHGFLQKAQTSIVRIAQRKPAEDKTTFQRSSHYVPSDSIWWDNDLARAFSSFLAREHKEIINTKANTMFAKYHERQALLAFSASHYGVRKYNVSIEKVLGFIRECKVT